jgi:transposase InsO family protein
MAYDTNPRLPALRAKAVDMVRDGKSVTEVARYFGFSKGAVSKWCKKSPLGGAWAIPTKSSAPHSHPRKIDEALAYRIKELRLELKGRCAQVIQAHLHEEGLYASVRTIQRTLERFGLLKKYPKWKKLHLSGERPKAQFPGDLVEIDTIHIPINQRSRLYVYTMIDVATRYAFARAEQKATTGASIRVVDRAKKYLPFDIACMQSDHGPEFGQYFTDKLHMRHRHSRVRKPNDNAHLERFNRTIQQELLHALPKDVSIINRKLPGYLRYYNEQRKHLGLELLTPAQAVTKCFQGHGG